MPCEPGTAQLNVRDLAGTYKHDAFTVRVWVNPYIESNERGLVQFEFKPENASGLLLGRLHLWLDQGVITGSFYGKHVSAVINTQAMFEQVTEAAAVGYVLQHVLKETRRVRQRRHCVS